MERQDCCNEMTYRQIFERAFNWLVFNLELIMAYTLPERIWVLYSFYLNKSGKFKPGVGCYWSGCGRSAKWGLEIDSFLVVNIVNHTAMHIYAEQTLPCNVHPSGSLLAYYSGLVLEWANELLKVSDFLVCDAYFSRNPFIQKMRPSGLHLISRLRNSIAIQYSPYLGPQKERGGRDKTSDGYVEVHHLDKQHFTPCTLCSEGEKYLEAKVYVYNNAWKCWAKVVAVQHYDTQGQIKSVKVYARTSIALSNTGLWLHYKARFQSEFLFRGYQAGYSPGALSRLAPDILSFHFSAFLTAVSLAKTLHLLRLPAYQRGTFSIADIKTQCFNELLRERFFVAYGLIPHRAKNNHAYKPLFKLGKIAA